MILTVNAKNAAALLPSAAWLQQVVAAEGFVSVKKFSNVYAAFDHVARVYQKQNYTPGGPKLWFPTLAELEAHPWYRDENHVDVPVGGERFFVVIPPREAGYVGHVGIFTRLDLLASVFIDAPYRTEAFEVQDLPAAVARIQSFIAENIMAFSGYFPMEEFSMVRCVPLNQMVALPYLAWMQANCVLPQGLQDFSLFGYAQPQLKPTGKPESPPDAAHITPIIVEGGES